MHSAEKKRYDKIRIAAFLENLRLFRCAWASTRRSRVTRLHFHIFSKAIPKGGRDGMSKKQNSCKTGTKTLIFVENLILRDFLPFITVAGRHSHM